MKKIVLLLLVIGAIGISSLAVKKTLHRLPVASTIPAAVITGNNFHWSASITAAAGYKKAVPSENGQTVLTKAQFKKNGTFDFVFSKINTLEQVQTETAVEGNVMFTKNETGKNCFVTTATKGNCREIKKGVIKKSAVPPKELSAVYSGTWLWEKITFQDIPSEDFLLLVNLKAHPSASHRIPGSIDKSWVSKFYIRK
jgi:hypothetical protein